MPARIYSLARELKLDSKELAEICAKAGVPGKSALSSLTDDEVVRLKEYLDGRGKASTGRSTASVGGGTATAALPERHTREAYIPPAGVMGKPPVIEPPKPDKTPEQKKRPLEPRPVNKPAPTVRLAQLPQSSSKSPPIPLKPSEPAPQKPDLKLPADVMRASKSGAKPLAEHLKKTEERRRSDEKAKPPLARPAARGAETTSPGPLSREARDRKRAKGGGPEFEDFPARAGRARGAATESQTPCGRTIENDSPDRRRRGPGVALECSPEARRRHRDHARRVKRRQSFNCPRPFGRFLKRIGISASQVLGKLLGLEMGIMPNIDDPARC